MKATKVFALVAVFAATQIVTLPAAAQAMSGSRPGMSKGIGDSTYRQGMFWTQNITLAGELTGSAKTGAITSSTGGYGINTDVKEFPSVSVSTLPKVPNVTGIATKTAVLQEMRFWFETSPTPFVTKMAAWMRPRGISQGYFTFTQDVMVSTATGNKKQTIVWSGFVESSGRAQYGAPKLADPDPTFLEVNYWSKKADDALPSHWKFNEAGKLTYRVVDKAFEPKTNWTEIETNGAYDEADGEQSTASKAFLCLVDGTGLTGCPAYPTVRTLVESTGTSGALLKYVRELQPVYEDDPDNTEVDSVEPVRAYSYEDRVWMCDRLENKGQFGFLLESTVDTFFVSEGIPRHTASLIRSEPMQALSATEEFNVSVTEAELNGAHPGSVLISPFPIKELWRIPSRQASAAVSIAPIRVNPVEGAGALSATSGDTYVTKTVEAANTNRYTIGTIGDNYLRNGVYERTFNFNLNDPKDIEEFRLLDAGFDDHLLVTLNNRLVYMGPNYQYRAGRANYRFHPMTANRCYGKDNCSLIDSGFLGTAQAPLTCTETRSSGGSGGGGSDRTITINNTGPFDSQGLNIGTGKCPGLQYLEGFALGNWDDRRGTGAGTEPWGGLNFNAGWELGGDWRVAPMADMTPYLVAGNNVLKVTIVVGGKGEFFLNIRERSTSCGGSLSITEAVAPPAGTSTTSLLEALLRKQHGN